MTTNNIKKRSIALLINDGVAYRPPCMLACICLDCKWLNTSTRIISTSLYLKNQTTIGSRLIFLLEKAKLNTVNYDDQLDMQEHRMHTLSNRFHLMHSFKMLGIIEMLIKQSCLGKKKLSDRMLNKQV